MQICEMMDVSRTVVREAIRTLTGKGHPAGSAGTGGARVGTRGGGDLAVGKERHGCRDWGAIGLDRHSPRFIFGHDVWNFIR